VLAVEETARQLGVSTDTVATWRRQGLLTAKKLRISDHQVSTVSASLVSSGTSWR
jgi:DNA-binding transcriptional MerR regulator